MKIAILFFVLVCLYAVFVGLGQSRRAQLWAFVKRHAFPIVAIAATLFFAVHLSMGDFNFRIF